jgi:hypothetical protein
MNNPAWPTKRLGGWAGGGYMCLCRVCLKTYVGNKRSWECYPCAKKKADAVLLKNCGEGI